MIQFGLLVPLLASGVVGAAVRHYRQKAAYAEDLQQAALTDQHQRRSSLTWRTSRVFDDVGELHHYQQVAWYVLAFAAASSWFFPPMAMISLPLLGYNGYHYYRILRHTDRAECKTPWALFETVSIMASLLTGRVFSASILFLISFGARKWLLQAGNISNNVGLKNALNPRLANIWVLREGAEIEISVPELQPDDVVILHPGDTVTVPGKIVQGSGHVRQFSLRKHMKQVPKCIGDQVYPFTRIASGHLHIQPH
jgi:cation transport ATPase